MLISYPSSLYCYPNPKPREGKNMTSHINNTSNALNRKSAAVYIIPTLHLRVLPVHAITRLYAAVRYLHLRDIYVPTYLYI